MVIQAQRVYVFILEAWICITFGGQVAGVFLEMTKLDLLDPFRMVMFFTLFF